MIVPTTNRKIEFEGNHKEDSLLIGNFGDVEFVANGQFDLSGMIYCPKGSIEFNVTGTGEVSFYGVCKRLIIKIASGNCRLDFSQLSCQEVQQLTIKENSEVVIGTTRIIRQAHLEDEAILHFSDKTILLNYSMAGNSQIKRLPKIKARELQDQYS